MSEEIKLDAIGWWIKGEAEGAIPVGGRVVKSRDEPGDTHRVGDMATVLSSLPPLTEEEVASMTPADYPYHPYEVGEYGYFVEWDDMPGFPVFVRGNKIAEAQDG